jgi:hypothetical protein
LQPAARPCKKDAPAIAQTMPAPIEAECELSLNRSPENIFHGIG